MYVYVCNVFVGLNFFIPQTKQRSVPVKQMLAGWIPLLGALQPRHIVLQIIADQLLQ